MKLVMRHTVRNLQPTPLRSSYGGQATYNLQPEAGFTIAELVIVVFLFAVLMLALFKLYDGHSNLFYYEQAEVAVAGSARSSLDEIQKYTLQAKYVLASHTFGSTTYSSNASTLVLQVPAVNGSGVIVNTWDYVVFYVSGTKLYRQIEAASGSSRTSGTKLFSETILSLTYTYDNSDFTLVRQVVADIQTRSTTRTAQLNAHEQQQIYLRNY